MSSSFLQTYRDFPVKKPDELERVLVQTYVEISQAANSKEVAQYELVETITGQQFYNLISPEQKRFTFRKCINFGALGAGFTNIAHGISPLVEFTYIGGTIVCPGNDFRPIPYVGAGATDIVSVRADAVNVIIFVGATMPAITSGRVILEYFKN